MATIGSRAERLNGHIGTENGPDSYGRQQWGILGNGGNPDPAMPREGRRSSDCKPLLYGMNGASHDSTVPESPG